MFFVKQSKNIELIAIIGNEKYFAAKISISKFLQKFQNKKNAKVNCFAFYNFNLKNITLLLCSSFALVKYKLL